MHYALNGMADSDMLYAYPNCQDIANRVGFIGHLYAELDYLGSGFLSTWNTFRDDLRTDEFKKEFDKLLEMLRSEGHFLRNGKALAAYCKKHPEYRFSETEYGVSILTDDYKYLLRLRPDEEFQLCVCCYKRDWFSSHVKDAKRGIRFISADYDDLFLLPDGGKIKICYPDGYEDVQVCRYIDPYHMATGYGPAKGRYMTPYHISEFAERLERLGCTVEPIKD